MYSNTHKLFICIINIALLSSILVSQSSPAQTNTDKQSEKLETVLDKLETKYLDRENSPLTYDEKRSKQMAKPDSTKETQKISNRKPILGMTPNQKSISEIQTKINEIEGQVDSLESDNRRFKEKTIQTSKIDNLVSIIAKLSDTKSASLRTLTARLDDSITFNQADSSGIWIPTSAITLYEGPLQPGSHKLELTIVINKTDTNGLIIPSEAPQQIQKTFPFQIAIGKIRKNLSVTIQPANSNDTKPTATFSEINSNEVSGDNK